MKALRQWEKKKKYTEAAGDKISERYATILSWYSSDAYGFFAKYVPNPSVGAHRDINGWFKLMGVNTIMGACQCG